MAVTEPVVNTEPPRGHVKVVYLGPVAPHWEVRSDFGDRSVVDEFRSRTAARLLLLPPHDPQFRRNRERVIRDAERENLLLEWDLGLPEDDYQPASATPPASTEVDASPEAEAASARAAEATTAEPTADDSTTAEEQASAEPTADDPMTAKEQASAEPSGDEPAAVSGKDDPPAG